MSQTQPDKANQAPHYDSTGALITPLGEAPATVKSSHETETAPEQKPIKTGIALTAVFIFLVVLVVLVVAGILPRQHSITVLAGRTNELAAPSVIATPPKAGDPIQELVLPGNVTAYTDAPVYARTSGYLTKWYYDIGAKVRKGAILAEIASPEIDQQLAQGQADLATAQATANNARTQADRYKGLVATERRLSAGHRHLRQSGRLDRRPGQIRRRPTSTA